MSGTISQLYPLMQAAHRRATELAPGVESLPFSWSYDHLSEEGWLLAHQVVHELRAEHAELFAAYTERQLLLSTLERLGSAECEPTLSEVASWFLEEAKLQGPWIIATPIANATMDRSYVPLGVGAALIRGWDREQPTSGEHPEAFEFDAAGEQALFEHLGDRLARPMRGIELGRQKWDTGRFVALQLVEEGGEQAALSRARAKAHYAVATWTLLSPPEGRKVFPDVGLWVPQPTFQITQAHRPFEKGRFVGTASARGNSIFHWGYYELPEDEVLKAPFEAFESLDKRPAQALLSATYAAFQASRGSRSQLSERIRHVQTAIEALCEKSPGRSGGKARWDRVAERAGAWRELEAKRGFSASEVEKIKERLVGARNISTHGADASLLDLGWGDGDRDLKFGDPAKAEDLKAAALHRDLMPYLHSVNATIAVLWKDALAHSFDPRKFEVWFAE